MLELVEGPTLADRIAQARCRSTRRCRSRGRSPKRSKPPTSSGIIHRDLKPANIKLRPDGTVKVLDFGSPRRLTRCRRRTVAYHRRSRRRRDAGRLILGTAAYMSPEQARGKAVDKRTDIWAFGCVLYEMLTGRRPFEGSDVTDILARILEQEPDFDALPGATPAPVRRCCIVAWRRIARNAFLTSASRVSRSTMRSTTHR